MLFRSKADKFIDFHGSVISEHVADRFWDMNKFLRFLRQQCNLSWKEIYYKIWSHLVTLHCAECDQDFVGAEIGQCVYHSQKARFGSGSSNGTYQCCGAPAIRFDTALRRDGCTARNHRLPASWNTTEKKDLYDKLIQRYNVIAEPFINDNQYEEKYKAIEKQTKENGRLNPKNPKGVVDNVPLSKIKDSPPFIVLIKMYITNVGESQYVVSEDEDEDEVEQTIATVTENNSRGKKDKCKVGDSGFQYSQKSKSWRIYELLNDDKVQMISMVKKLKRFRGDAPAPALVFLQFCYKVVIF